MRGAGDALSPIWISVFTTVIVRVPLAYTIAAMTKTAELPNGRYESVFVSLLVSWVLGALFSFFVYRLKKWKTTAE